MIQEIKNAMGDMARDRIVSDLGLKFNGSHYSCPFPSHSDDHPSAEWKPYAFNCYSCGGGGHKNMQYDIFTHYQMTQGMEIPETIELLCNELGLQNTSETRKSERKFKVEQSDKYKQSAKPSNQVDSDFKILTDRGISKTVAQKYYTGVSGDEFLMHGYEIIEDKWQPVYTKRRLLTNEKYSNDSKELNIAGGLMCFYGMTELREKDTVIICEGQLDALRLATEIEKNKSIADKIAVLSVPNGGRSFNNAINNSPTFRRWHTKHCKSMIIIPDADATGRAMIDQVREFDCSDKVKWFDLTKINGVRYSETHGVDISDVLNKFNVPLEQIFKLSDFLPVDGLKKGSDVEVRQLKDGIASGFITHDYNDSGLKEGCLTVLSGRRGGGKTTLAKQIVMCAAQQGIKSFCFFGESDIELEKSSFSRMVALEGEITYRENIGGRRIYMPNQNAIDRYDSEYGDKIFFHCVKKKEIPKNLFQCVLDKMQIALRRGCYLFLVDNLMLLTKKSGSSEFDQQAQVTMALKKFALDNDVHVILVAHPKNGELKVSGSMEIEQRADTILHYVRMNNPDTGKMLNEDGIPPHEGEKVSAVILNDKIRNDGESRTVFLQWDKNRGVVMEITSPNLPKSTQEKSKEYYEQGWFSKPCHKYDEEQDQPPAEPKF